VDQVFGLRHHRRLDRGRLHCGSYPPGISGKFCETCSELEQLIGYKITQDLTASVGVWQAFVVGVFLYILMIVAVGAIFAVTDVHNILPLFRWPPTFSQCVTLTSAAAVTFVALRAIWTSTMHWGWRLVIAVLFATAWVTAYYYL
jgi:tetrahydromethanopterin S-methyltransferase subunit G